MGTATKADVCCTQLTLMLLVPSLRAAAGSCTTPGVCCSCAPKCQMLVIFLNVPLLHFTCLSNAPQPAMLLFCAHLVSVLHCGCLRTAVGLCIQGHQAGLPLLASVPLLMLERCQFHAIFAHLV